MKKKFEGTVHGEIPPGIIINKWLNSDSLGVLRRSSDTPFSLVTHPDYICTEYRTKMNLFTFGRLKFYAPMTVIGPPISADSPGYGGDLNKLIADYKRRRGIHLILNIPERPALTESAAIGETLPSCVFRNRFSSVEEYFSALRGSYRRRLKQALEKGTVLRIEKINNLDFTEELHGLYMQVLKKSRYPLESMNSDFFKHFGGEIFVFRDGAKPVAFAALKLFGKELDFVFGGMDYSARDRFDLYYNMLLLIIRQAIETKAELVNFGQTAEPSKQRVGCSLSKRYMVAFSGNPLINGMLKRFGNMLSYRAPKEVYRCFNNYP